jgi:hypothetical protein
MEDDLAKYCNQESKTCLLIFQSIELRMIGAGDLNNVKRTYREKPLNFSAKGTLQYRWI